MTISEIQWAGGFENFGKTAQLGNMVGPFNNVEGFGKYIYNINLDLDKDKYKEDKDKKIKKKKRRILKKKKYKRIEIQKKKINLWKISKIK